MDGIVKSVAVAVLLLVLLGVASSMRDGGYDRGPSDVGCARAQMSNFGAAIASYREKHGVLPPSLQVLSEADPRSGEAYIERIPKDPWGSPYEYGILSDTECRILSRGEDCRAGTRDDMVWPSEE